MRLAAIALGALLVCMGGRAWADDAAAAREHAQKATTFYKLAKYDDAIREFEAAYEAKEDPALLYNIAQCHRLAGHEGEALRLYRNYLRDAPRGPYRAQADQWIAALEKSAAERPASLPVTPASPETPPPNAPPAPIATTPGPPGPGPAETSPPGSYPATQPPPGEAPVAQPLPPAPLPQPEPVAPATSSGRRTAGVVVASIGGAFVVGGAICGLVARAQSKKVEDAASAHQAFDPAVEKTGQHAETAQWIGYGVGAAALAVGVILIATSPSSTEAAPQGRVALAPLAGPGLGGALMQVAF